MAEEHRGSCLCGAVEFRIRGDLGEIGHCHCLMCQKAHGAAFGTYVNVAPDDLVFVRGEEDVARYQSSSNVVRTFCRHCGSTLQFIRDGSSGMGIAAASFDTALGTPDYEIFTSRTHAWCSRDDLPLSHPTHPGYQGD